MTTTLLGKITLESLYTAQELAEKRLGIRRIMKESEIKIEPSQISQPIDIDVYLEGDQTKEMSNMSDYPYRSLENSIRYIKEVQTFGIKSVVLRLVGKPLEKSYMVYDVLKDHVDAIKTIRKYFPKDVLDITVDPFSLALNDDGSWGIKDQNGEINYWDCIELLGNLTLEFSHIGVDSIVTLGRLQGEVRAVKKVLQARNSDVKIKSFSQNSETRNAYMYLKSTPDKLDTGQKILVGNVTEMQLQTILDIYEGTDTVIVKPTESTHLITLTTLLIDDKNRVLNFLTSNKVKEILKGNHHSRQQVTDILQNMDSFNAKCGQIKVGGYTVSGTYYLQKKLQEEKGDIFAFNVVDELLKNSISAAGDHLDAIIDRNALWYLKMKKS